MVALKLQGTNFAFTLHRTEKTTEIWNFSHSSPLPLPSVSLEACLESWFSENLCLCRNFQTLPHHEDAQTHHLPGLKKKKKFLNNMHEIGKLACPRVQA